MLKTKITFEQVPVAIAQRVADEERRAAAGVLAVLIEEREGTTLKEVYTLRRAKGLTR